MDATRHNPSNRFRLVVAIAYAIAVIVVLTLTVPRGTGVPAVLIALSVLLIFRRVPRNWIYGLRTPRTLRGTDETWYRQNAIAGMVGTAIGVVWLLVSVTR
jgi:hypothetical protein